MHRSHCVFVLMIALATPCLASAATAKKEIKKRDLPDCDTVQLDGSNLKPEERDLTFSIQKSLMTTEILGFAVGAETILGEYYDERKGKEFNADVLKIKQLAKQESFSHMVEADFDAANAALGEALKDHKLLKDAYNVVECRIAAIGSTATNAYNMYATSYLKGLQSKQAVMHGQVGYFDVTVNGCTISKSIDTGNRYSRLKPDPDARYLTVNATFKNIDNEGRIPLEGSLFISKDGKDFKFDTTETIMNEGYGIRLRSLNPLIKLNTKIVYKVPNELSGEVYWKPGRNAHDKKLWCTYLPSA
ncbi:DUF4352 domain-containing protein [Pseudomonas sp. 21LCFQ010]|uniref:DUF4352 domain-containing protein n=1 Tax=Pseudomonas sp. 21LCFQ010 TaxID=2957506 RepID=UPI00209864E7|nr:DUF4352 domain-containing protein [Pseudomonas sp. 21LCFQ010]MCO8163896.1 DUF4352 domain-containing protein [Pseudomonas sp. 21LCFQ010]